MFDLVNILYIDSLDLFYFCFVFLQTAAPGRICKIGLMIVLSFEGKLALGIRLNSSPARPVSSYGSPGHFLDTLLYGKLNSIGDNFTIALF